MRTPSFLKTLVATAITACIIASAGATTYHVATTGSDSTGDGSAGNPWATIIYADTIGLLLPGDTVVVEAGTYPQAAGGAIIQVCYGTPSQPITYLANGKVIIDQSSAVGISYGIEIWAENIIINGFEIKGASHGISVSGTGINEGFGSVISNCIIHDSNGTDSSGVQLLSVSNVVVIGNLIYNINASANSPWAPVGAGIRMSAGNNNFMFNNTIDNCYLGIFYYGASLGGGPYGHITTENNIISNSKGWGLVNPWSVDTSLFTSDHNLLYNNIADYGNYPGGAGGPGPGDINGQDPKFVFPLQHDYHLLTNSPAVDTGTNVGRTFLGSAPDMGAFEGQYPPASVGTYHGKVTANSAGNPAVPRAVVQTLDGNITATTDANGNYVIVLAAGNNSLKAGAKAMSEQTLSAVVSAGGQTTLDFSLALANSPKTNYVDNVAGNDNNPGTAAQPWKTIGNGDAKGLLNPGDTVIVNSGTYVQAASGGVSLTNGGGYSFAPVSYIAQGTVLIDQSGYAGTSYGFKVAAGGITLKGFEIKGAQHGIYLGPGSDYATVTGCSVHDGNAAGGNAEGIFADQSSHVTLTRNLIYNITDASDTPWSPVGCGIAAGNAASLQVWNNTIDNCFLGVFFHGGTLGSGPYGHITVQNNIVVNCAGWAFVNPWSTDPTFFTVGYNLVFGNTTDYGNFPAGNSAVLGSDIVGNPGFVNGPSHDYHLQTNSPALNIGLDVGMSFVGVAPDLGAWESPYSAALQTYYVDSGTGNDSNPGTLAQPWLTIQNGDVKGTLNAGDTVVVKAGTYPQPSLDGVYLVNRHGTLNVPITYKAQGRVIIDQSIYTASSYGFKIGVGGIALDGFEVKKTQHGIYIAPGCDGCSVNACTVHDANAINQDAEGVFVDRAAEVKITRNIFYNINDPSHTPWGPVGCGVRVGNAQNVKVWNNTIDNVFLGLFFHGSAPGGGPYGHIYSQNNIVVNCTGWGFVNPWSTDGTLFTSDHNLVFADATTYGNYPAGNNAPMPTDVAQNPQFVNAVAHDYHLANGSSAIRAGVNVGLPFGGSAPSLGALEPLFLGLTSQPGGLQITWLGSATLQTATAVNGPWSDLTGAASPCPVTNSAPQQFFRLKQ